MKILSQVFNCCYFIVIHDFWEKKVQRMAKEVLYLSFFPLPFLPGRRVGEGRGGGVELCWLGRGGM